MSLLNLTMELVVTHRYDQRDIRFRNAELRSTLTIVTGGLYAAGRGTTMLMVPIWLASSKRDTMQLQTCVGASQSTFC